MALGSPNFLNLATTTASNLNLQIPSITVNLDRSNYPLWHTTIISALEAFDLDDYVLNPRPPSETIGVPVVAVVPTTTTSPAIVVVPATTAPNPEYTIWKKRDQFVLIWLKSTMSDNAHALIARTSSSQQALKMIETLVQSQTTAN